MICPSISILEHNPPDFQKVTCIHKANIMKLGDGLFLNTFRKVAEEYKLAGIEANDMIIDNTCVTPCVPRRVQLLFSL